MTFNPNQQRDDHGRWGSGGGSLDQIANDSQRAKLTAADNKIIKHYRFGGGSVMNTYLRNPNRIIGNRMDQVRPSGQPMLDDYVRSLDATIEKFSLSEDTKVYRVIPASIQRLLSSKPTGATFEDKGFVSTTYNEEMIREYLNLNREIATRKGINTSFSPIEIFIPKGTKAIPWLGRDVDHEVLIKRGSRFRIAGKDRLEVLP